MDGRIDTTGAKIEMATLLVHHVDTHLASQAPLGALMLKKHILAIEKATKTYTNYGLPESHPTMIRIQYQLAQLKRKNGEIDEAEFAENEARRHARQWLQDELRRSGDGRHVGYNVYAEDARFLKELLKDESVMVGVTVEAGEALATPRSPGDMP